MDFLTHTLVGAGAARLLARRRDQIAQLMPAALIGALLPDFDSWLYFWGLDNYGRYHRILTHSVWALGIIVVQDFPL